MNGLAKLIGKEEAEKVSILEPHFRIIDSKYTQTCEIVNIGIRECFCKCEIRVEGTQDDVLNGLWRRLAFLNHSEHGIPGGLVAAEVAVMISRYEHSVDGYGHATGAHRVLDGLEKGLCDIELIRLTRECDITRNGEDDRGDPNCHLGRDRSPYLDTAACSGIGRLLKMYVP